MQKERSWVLVVDDSEAMRSALSAIVSALGFRVTQASNGLEAMTLFLQRPFELVLTDLHMPGMDGWTLASAIKGQSPLTPVVLVTGSGQESVRARSDQGCVDCVIFKPFRLLDIERAVQFFMEMKTGWTGGQDQAAAQA
ncbi:MAG: response regulator [Thermodesulfobacteriota bacterium]